MLPLHKLLPVLFSDRRGAHGGRALLPHDRGGQDPRVPQGAVVKGRQAAASRVCSMLIGWKKLMSFKLIIALPQFWLITELVVKS